ncbi:pilus assembly protein PilM [Microbacterium sp. CFH 90308]|uniref:Pilus assembly protein PilM n=1 Tax=Microbacterium salsuginis TaxID=2722803 RepID=A0ABX1KIS8_9MICO|nr:pilus assembly protein PilM [Microbacterium sp. CFH 90308]NLP85913.1 pilus assembly protein PilM [Microbacterium sp. CFH 90308]
MAKSTVGVEITEESVRAVELTTGRSPSVVTAGEVPLPRDAAKDSEVLDPDAVAVALRQLWSGAGIRNRKVTLGVGSRRILVREYTTQAMRPDLLREALPFQVQDLLPVPVSQAVLDFYPFAQQGDQVTGLLVAAVSESIEQLIATLAKAKLEVDNVDLVPFGLARVAKRVAKPGETVAMIHIGDHTSHVVAVTDGIPHFVRIIPVDVATTAARREELAFAAPEFELDALLETVPPQPFSTRASMRTTAAASAPAAGDLVARLRSTIAFFGSRPGAPAISTAWVSGAGYAAPGVADTLSRSFDVPVLPVRLDQFADTGKHGLPEELSLNAVATAGILLGEVSR